VILRGKKVLEYSIPSFIPEWMLPEIAPPSVFDDPIGTFEPTFGSGAISRSLGNERTEKTKDVKANASASSESEQQEQDTVLRQNAREKTGATRNPDEMLSGEERGRRVYDWSSGADRRIPSSPTERRPGRSSRDYGKNEVSRQRRDTEDSRRDGSLGFGGTAVLILYIIAFFAIGLLGLLEDLWSLDNDGVTTFASGNVLRKDW